ncbi:MAG: hypothetical protein ACLUEV_07810 [Alistipes sp.]
MRSTPVRGCWTWGAEAVSGIPLAILFPEVRFTLVDSIGKKIRVVRRFPVRRVRT